MCYNVHMGDFFSQVQSQKQTQVQVMSQMQIHALKILSMDTDNLRDEIAKAANENPVLVIDDGISDAAQNKIKSSSRISQAAQKSSDAFQAIIEQKEDFRESLREHLLHQLHMERLDATEISVGEKLIQNLDSHGHHILEPETLLDKSNPGENVLVLKKCMKLIQSLDPVGVCTKNVEETLLVQARQNPEADELSLFILDGHLDFINPPAPSRALKKLQNFFESRRNMFGLGEEEKKFLSLDLTEDDVQASIDFIRTLTPFPASRFSTEEVHLVSPDIYVSEVETKNLDADLVDPALEKKLREKGILKTGNRFWKIRIENSKIPAVSIAPEIQKNGANEKDLKEKIKAAEDFVAMLENRKNTIEKSAWEIVRIQHEFFEKGAGHLVPMRLRDLAQTVGVSESTISRMANGKYLQYNGSVYPLKYFFENSVSTPSGATVSDDGQKNLSRDNVQLEIKKILEEHKDDKKKLSDQKISDMLEERGIKIARRTVAKYRTQLNIDSSYDRV